jgi:hypothetical protein
MTSGEYRTSALLTSALNAGVGSLGTAIVIGVGGLPIWPVASFVASGILGLAVLLAWRQAPRWACLAILQLNFTTGLLTAGFTAEAQMLVGGRAEVFEWIKLSLLVIAMASPSIPIGLPWLAAFGLVPFLLTMSWPAGLRALLPLGEPWLTGVFVLAAAGIMVFRQRAAVLQRELARARADKVAAERVARLSIAVRDLSNSPLQTLSSGVALLADQSPEVRTRMERAVRKLHDINVTLTRADEALGFRTDAFDAQSELEAALRRIN